jgi:hypothetical protein
MTGFARVDVAGSAVGGDGSGLIGKKVEFGM